MNLKKYNLQGEEIGEVALDDTFLEAKSNAQMTKDYIVAMRRNARQWSANTKGRKEVSHSNKKPFRQKGTGNARQGSLASPQYRGGGIVFGPKPKFNQHVRINQKERRLATRSILAEKISEGKVMVMEDAAFNSALQTPSTKTVAALLKKENVYGRLVLFIGEGHYNENKVSLPSDQHAVFKRSVQNIPSSTFTKSVDINGYDVAVSHKILMTESALAEIVEQLK